MELEPRRLRQAEVGEAGPMNRRAIMDWKGGSALTLVWCRVLDAGFALPCDADRRSAFPC